jgi:hypothetical protein
LVNSLKENLVLLDQSSQTGQENGLNFGKKLLAKTDGTALEHRMVRSVISERKGL